ncbi:MAG: transporter, partial [Kofleriaceae bacterium]|nr:transporter [Kofleriaceae bacterium]
MDQQDGDADSHGSACENGAALMRCGRQVAGLRVAALAAIVGATLLARANVAQAQAVVENRDFPVERFHLATDRNGLFGVEWGALRSQLASELSFWVGYANEPLALYRNVDGTRERVGDLVGNRVGGELAASYAVLRWLQLSVSIPLVLQQDRDATIPGVSMDLASISGVAFGDIRLLPKFAILRQAQHHVDVAVMAELGFPTGRAKNYRGDHGLTVHPTLLLSRRDGRWRYAANLGYFARKSSAVVDQRVDDEISLRLGGGYRFATTPLELTLTVSAAVAAAQPFANFNQNYHEVIGGPSFQIGDKLIAFAAGGVGLSQGFGTPDFRMLAGLRVGRLQDRPQDGDADNDGIRDSRDACRTQKEDLDGFKDADGCPDDDNDSDGIVDAQDTCRNDAEDQDGFDDADGCPDADNDNDGFRDAVDKCPLVAETVNGFQDDDGCPDIADRDGDGINNQNDPCPDDAEDLDNFEDADGCPDPDNESDGTLDINDKCVDVVGPVENFGCPDTDRDGDGVMDRLDNCPDEPGKSKNQGCKDKQLVVIRGGRLDILDVVYFKVNKDEILQKSNKLLDNVVRVLNVHTEIAKVQVQGHTDSQGDDAYNLD